MRVDYEWKLYEAPEDRVVQYMRALNASRVLASYFVNHNISTDTAAAIMNADYEGIYYPLALTNIHEAAMLLKEYLVTPDTVIHVFADYDTDGITSAALACKGLMLIDRMMNPKKETKIWYSIPERKDGYGLSVTFAEHFVTVARQNPETKYLVLTVDNGITAKPAVDILQSEPNVRVLVTDHHEPDYEKNLTPTRDCICVDPKIVTGSEGAELAGCGVIFNVLQELEDLCELDHSVTLQLYYLMAIGTVGDMMNLDIYHACIVQAGLLQMNWETTTYWVQQIRNKTNIPRFTAKDIAFTLSPIINSCGQMGCANLAFQMLVSQDEKDTAAFVDEVYQIYLKNKAETKEARERAELDIEENYIGEHKFILYPMPTERPGLVSKVATHIAKQIDRPLILWAETEENKNEELITGSARNDTDLPALQIVRDAVRAGFMESAEGHMFAFGVKLYRSKIPMLQQFLDDKISAYEKDRKDIPARARDLTIDCVVSTDDINAQTMADLERIPFVKNLSAPVVMIRGARICKVKASKNNANNICYTIQSPNAMRPIDIWAWNVKPDEYKDGEHTRIDMIGTIERNFMMPRYATLNVVDLKCY